ncbi:hypothetical protein Clacol_006654 [Clathrus columnatus]|uniref:Phospholipid-transporting ATPase n=1 Tax=Clathrus columnatus TaxID=1419009 RepID=A0AAV5AF96_9AGAM|nr:hypothetical protein Clacol_006654 [Clathrus columnatus]
MNTLKIKMPKQSSEQSLKGLSSKQPAKKRKVSDDELSELTSSPSPSDREGTSPPPNVKGSVKARDMPSSSNKRPVKKRRVVSDDDYEEDEDLVEEKNELKIVKRDTKVKAKVSIIGKSVRNEGQRIAKVDEIINVQEEQEPKKSNSEIQTGTVDVLQKKKLPTIKKKAKPLGVLPSSSASVTPSTVPSPSSKPPVVPGSGTNKEVAPLTTLNPSGSGDFDLRDSNTWQSLLGKKNSTSGPRVGIEKRVSTQERRKQLDKMREEARALRNEQLKTTFDLQAQSQKILRYEKSFSRQQIQAPHILGAAFKDRPIDMSKSWSSRISDWKVESLFSRRAPPQGKRSIFVNEPLPSDYFDRKHRPKKEHIYTTNQIVTSKYTVFTFIPRNLLEQFRRIANVFFLVVDILQFFPKFATINAGLVVLPLIIVIGITAIKDGYEDIKRHQGDRRVNHSTTLVLSGDDWENPNPSGKKSKTFVRGVLKRKKKINDSEVDAADGNDIEYDEEESTQALDPSNPYAKSVSTAHWKKTFWEDIRVGDFIKIRSDEPIPADVLICTTSEEDNEAFIETKNLDGETNLKSRQGVNGLQYLRTARDCATSPGFQIDCDAPDVSMFRLNGAVVTKEGTHPISLQTTLLRGTVLRNTKWVIGLVLYTGEDTKISLNSGDTPSKRSLVERQMNPQVMVNLIILALMAVVCGIVDAITEQRKFPEGAPWLFDDNQSDDNPHINGLVTWANGLITFQNIIPISLYLSVEFVRTCQAAFIYSDHQIYNEETGQATLARSWNLSDDLGHIEYIFSDKTGTLTQNIMVFRQCSVAGSLYAEDQQPEKKPEKKPERISEEKIEEPGSATDTATSLQVSTEVPDPKKRIGFRSTPLNTDLHNYQTNGGDIEDPFSSPHTGFFAVLALCHTVLAAQHPERNEIQYKAQSPDEAALVQAAADVGFVFLGREREIIRMRTPFNETPQEFELLNVLEFTSARKRMSVLLRKVNDPNKRIYLLSKGADNVIYERLRKDESEELKSTTQKHLDEFANDVVQGLRTLCLAYKVLPEADFETWEQRYHDATVALDNREEKVEQVSAEIETDLHLLGATAIEDKLQDGVPETIADLKRAGIKIWVLTGDKLETAIAIGYSTNLVARESNLIVVRGGDDGKHTVEAQLLNAIEQFFPGTQDLQEKVPLSPTRPINPKRFSTGLADLVGKDNGMRPGGFVLVIDGLALGHALDSPSTKELLLKIGLRCEAVICCRVSPLQKALVVRLIKDNLQTTTLAIGDGANDVSMIQAAHVGIGIRGEEGLQAVNSADYAIAQVGLPRRNSRVAADRLSISSIRTSSVLVYYGGSKYIALGALNTSWNILTSFSGTYSLPCARLSLLAYLIALLVGPLASYFTPVLIVSDANILMAVPELYRYGRENTWFGFRLFTAYMLEGIVQSVIIFFIITYAYFSISARNDGYDTYIYEFSTAIAIVTVTVANCFNGLNTSAWSGWVWFAVSIGIIIVWVYTRQYWPTDIDILKEVQKVNPHIDFATHPSIGGRFQKSFMEQGEALTTVTSGIDNYPLQVLADRRQLMDLPNRSVTDMSLGGIQSTNRGFDFAVEEGGVHLRRIQTNLSERRFHLRRKTKDTSGKERRALFPSLKRTIRSIRTSHTDNSSHDPTPSE